jgi:Skp family chaperone for outer membrane proteins
MSQDSQATQSQNQSQPTPQEVLQSLERDFNTRVNELNAARESYYKNQEQIIAAYDAMFKAFQTLSINKERYLVNLIGQYQAQMQTMSQELSKTKQLNNSLMQQMSTVKSPMPAPTPAPGLTIREDNVAN